MLQGQESGIYRAKAIIHKVKDHYETQAQYNVAVKYAMYDGYEGALVLETYDGVLVKNNNDFYSKIYNTESLQLASHFVKVNHDEKALLYGKVNGESKKNNGLNLEILFQNFNKAIVKEKEASYLIEMMAPEISQSPYGKAILEINKSDYSLKKQVLFFSNTIPVKTQNGGEKFTNPRLEVVFSNFSVNNDQYKSKFNLSSFVSLSKTGNNTSSRLKDYQFIDTTRQ